MTATQLWRHNVPLASCYGCSPPPILRALTPDNRLCASGDGKPVVGDALSRWCLDCWDASDREEPETSKTSTT